MKSIISEIYKKKRVKLARKIADEFILRDRPNDTIVPLEDGGRAIINKEKAPLLDPDLFIKITEEEFDKTIVGEKKTRKVIFLCSCGRLIENHQIASYNLLINDDAGIGKDYVANAVLSILPKENYIHKTRISPTVFTYWHTPEKEPEWTWDGKVFYPEDISEGVLNSDVFKVMCSSGSSATIVIRQEAVDIDIEGKPVMITTTASAVPNPELTRRFAILNLDSSTNQTKAIMKRHSEYAKKGITPEYDSKYRIAMTHLKRVKVKVPFADRIHKFFPENSIMMRTNYPRFLDFIKASAGFHQYQRKEERGYVLAEGQDYDIARECFLKLCSNKYMISLTINQKKILGVFEKFPILRGSVTQLHSKMDFLSIRALQTNLGILSKYNILRTETDKDSYGRDMDVYSLAEGYNPNEKIEIPTYKELCRNTSTSITSITSDVSITSSTSKKDVEDVEDVIPKLYKNNADSHEKKNKLKGGQNVWKKEEGRTNKI